MQIIQDISSLRKFVAISKQQNKTVALVPTMGYLHKGHQALMLKAKQECDIVVTSIFVNPLQFGVNEDLDKYPRNLEGDIALCEESNVDVLFTPTCNEMYPNGQPLTYVNTTKLDSNLCGASRPGHFKGVCTVVSKLFNLTLPDKAYFGRKDIQQLRIIETMVNDLNFPIEIIACDTVRCEDGLALSSRNSYLSPPERETAIIVPQLLNHIVSLIQAGQLDVKSLIQSGLSFLSECKIAKLDYLEIVDYSNLELLDCVKDKIIIATAIYIGKTRLIDNIVYDLKDL